jgi:ubiquitin-conjugating enzyme E2 J1
MSAPDIILLTPNGRFELNKKICIDGLTSFHAGSWQPAWGVRTAITGLRSFWNQDGEALSAIGALDYPKEERKRLARLSGDWVCATCGVSNAELLPDPVAGKGKGKEGDEGVKEKDEKEGVKEDKVVEDGVKDEDEDKGTVEAGPLPPGGSAPLPAAAAAVTAAAVATQAPSSGPPPPTPAARPVPPSISPPTASAAAPAAVPAPTPAPRTPVTAVPPTTAAAVPGPTPAPALAPTRTTLAPAVAAAHPHVPARFTARAAPAQTRGSPLWLDVLIGALVMLLVAMLVRH